MKSYAKLSMGIVFLFIFILFFTSYSMKEQVSTTKKYGVEEQSTVVSKLSWSAISGAAIGAGYLLYKKLLPYVQGDQSEGVLWEDLKKALLNAAKENDCAMIMKLLDAGADINATDSEGRTALMGAVDNGSIDAVQCLLKNPGIVIDQEDNQGNTALLLAIKQRNKLIIKQLLDAGADPEFINKNGVTPRNAVMRASYPRDYRTTVAEILSLINKAIIKKHGGENSFIEAQK